MVDDAARKMDKNIEDFADSAEGGGMGCMWRAPSCLREGQILSGLH